MSPMRGLLESQLQRPSAIAGDLIREHRILSIGVPLAHFFERGLQSHVLARFDSTLQLESDDGSLWTITTRPNPGAMRAVVPMLPEWSNGAIICVRDRRIIGPGFELAWDPSASFDPVPHQRSLTSAGSVHAARMIAGALARWQLPVAQGFWDELADVWEPLALCLTYPATCLNNRGTRGRVEELVLRLIGCGPGLTPAGDDFLQALIVTLQSGDGQDYAAFESLVAAVGPCLHRTMRSSRAFLLESMKGWAFGALKDVLDDLPVVTQGRMDALLGIGASSGPVYALGVLMGLACDRQVSSPDSTALTEHLRISCQ